MTEENGLIVAYLLDGRGGGKQIQWSDVKNWTSDAGTLWVHLDYTHPEATKWLDEENALDPALAEGDKINEGDWNVLLTLSTYVSR